MTFLVANPDSTISNTGSLVGGATAHAVLGGDDGTYVELDPSELVEVGFADLAIPAGGVVKSCKLILRTYPAVVGQNLLTSKLTVDGVSKEVSALIPNALVQWFPVGVDGDNDPDLTTARLLAFTSPPGGAIRVTTAVLSVEYVAKPVVTVSAPSGTLTDDNRPLIDWDVALDASGGPQFAAIVKLFDSATYSGGGFDPNTSTPIDSAFFTGAVSSWRPTAALPNGTYRAYVFVSQVFGAGQSIASDWAYTEWIENTDLPAVPTIAIVDVPNGYPAPCMWIAITGNAGAATTDAFQIQRKEGAEWVYVRTRAADGVTTEAPASIYDFECATGEEVTYRVRAIHHYANADAYSDWIESSSQLDPTQWGIHHPTSPDLSVGVDLRSFPSHERAARQSVKQPLGRSDAVVLLDERAAETGQIAVRARTDTERDRIMALAAEKTPVLLNPASGHHEPQRWAVLGDETVERKVDNAFIDERDASYGWTEVTRPSGLIVAWPSWNGVALGIAGDDVALLWDLDETSGTDVLDASGKGNDGQFYDNQVVATTGVQCGVWPPLVRERGSHHSLFVLGDWAGGPPEAQVHPGAGIRAKTYKPCIGGSKRSFCAWLNKTNDDSFQTIFSTSGGTGTPGPSTSHEMTWEMGHDPTSGGQMMRFYANVATYPFGFVDWGAETTGHPGPSPFLLFERNFIVCTFDDATGIAEWYVNGKSQGKQGPVGYLGSAMHYNVTDPGLFQFGWRGNYTVPNTEVFGGFADKIMVVERILTAEEIDVLWRAGVYED